jgi:hypothetical protein
MISKVIKPGRSFAGACRYLLNNRDQAEVILSEGIRDYNYQLMTADFESQRNLNPALKSPVQHIILSWCAGELIGNEKMAEIAAAYLIRIQVSNTQFAVVKHADRDNPHVHILFNRVDNTGRTIKDSFLGLRGKKVAQQLTQEYGLIPAIKKDLQQTQMERLNDYDATRYEIFQAIHNLLPKCTTMDELKNQLEREKIGMVYKFKGQTNQIQGISFTKGKFKYKGSEVDRQFSYGKLSIRFSQKQSYRLSQKLKVEAGTYKHQSLENSLLEQLLRSEYMDNHISHDFLPKKHKRKHKGI